MLFSRFANETKMAFSPLLCNAYTWETRQDCLRGKRQISVLDLVPPRYRGGNKKLHFSSLLCFNSLSLVPPRKPISHFAFIFVPHITMAGKVLMRISSPKHPAALIPLHHCWVFFRASLPSPIYN